MAPGGGAAVDMTLGGNSTSAGAGFILMSSGTVTLAGGPNVTLSQNGNAVTISGAAGGGGTQTAISGISVSNTDFTSGTVEIVGSGGGVTVGSAPGQKVVLSVAAPVAQSNQTANVIDMTLAGNSTTAGAGAILISSGTMTLAGGNNVTLSQNGNAVTISAASQSVQPQTNQAGSVYAISNTSGTSSGTYDARTLSIAGAGIVTVAASNSGWRINASQSVQTQSRFDMTVAGNSTSAGAGFIELSSGTVTLAGGNNITISQNGNALTISGANVGGAQTGISGIVASDATYTSGTVTFSGVGGGVTVNSNTGQRVDISVAAPVAQTNQSGSVFATSNTFGTSSGTYDARTLSIAGSGAVSVAASNSGWVISAPAQSVQPQSNQTGSVFASSNTFGTSSGTYDARTLSLAGSGIVSVAASNSGFVINASTAAQTNQAGSVYAISNTQGTSSGTYDARTLSIAGEGIITVAASNSGWRISASQSVQTQGVLSIGASTGGNTSGNTTVNTGSRLVFVGSNNITVSQGTAAGATTLTLSGPTIAAQTNQTGSVFAVSNTTGTSSGTYDARTLSIAGDGIISVAASNSGFRISASQSVQTQSAFNLTLSGNSTSGGAGFALVSSGTLSLAGGPNITLSQDGNHISISGASGGGAGFSAGVSTGGNTAGSTGVTGTRVVYVGTGPISLSQATDANGGTVSINAPATSSLSATGLVSISTNGSTISIGAPDNTIARWQNMPMPEAVVITHLSDISKVPIYWLDQVEGRLTANTLAFRLSNVATATLQSFSAHFGVYTLVNSTSAALVGSVSEAYILSTASSASWSGIRNYVMTGIGTHASISTLSQGHYMFGMMFSAGATGSMHQSLFGAASTGGPLGGIYPGSNQASTGTSQGVQGLFGRGSTTVNALPANVQASELVNQGQGASMQLYPWIFIRS